MIAPTAIIRGAGMSFNFDIIEVEGTTGYYNSNLNNKALKAVELI
jgi:2,3-bisphosphoglycerate-independent phosphoglycerate mutase